MSRPISQDKDISLRKEAVDKALAFMKDKTMPDVNKSVEVFKELYKQIYYFISNKPYG